jgi:hypothetical protein
VILGLSVAAFTFLHVAISLIGIVTGFIVVAGMLAARRLDGWTTAFLATTILTSVTGFFFHSKNFGPPHVIGVISLAASAPAVWAFYGRKLAGVWRPIYVATAVLALYLNVFVGVVQAFQKIPALAKIAPTQSEPPFVAAQVGALAVLVVLGVFAMKRFKPAPAA